VLLNQDVAAASSADTPAAAASTSEEQQTETIFEQLFTAVVTATDGDRVLCQPFKVLPCRTVCVVHYVTLLVLSAGIEYSPEPLGIA